MRLFEIDDLDRTWAASKGILLDIDIEYNTAKAMLDTLIKLNSPYRNKQWMPNIDMVIRNLQEIINANFANDASTTELKNKASKMLAEIERLKSTLRI